MKKLLLSIGIIIAIVSCSKTDDVVYVATLAKNSTNGTSTSNSTSTSSGDTTKNSTDTTKSTNPSNPTNPPNSKPGDTSKYTPPAPTPAPTTYYITVENNNPSKNIGKISIDDITQLLIGGYPVKNGQIKYSATHDPIKNTLELQFNNSDSTKTKFNQLDIYRGNNIIYTASSFGDNILTIYWDSNKNGVWTEPIRIVAK